MARPKTNNGICKICGRPAGISHQADGTPYTRALCHRCRNRKARLIASFQCERCGWKGYCDIHHKDGNHSNNKRNNLEILCPNCHRNHHSPLPKALAELVIEKLTKEGV